MARDANFKNDMNTPDFFRSMFAIEIESMRNTWMVSLLCVGILYLYRLITVVRCMRTPVDQFATPVDRLIWVGLSIFVPPGFGAYLYDITQRRKFFSLMFLIPIAIIAFNVIRFGYPMMMRMTNFTFGFLGF